MAQWIVPPRRYNRDTADLDTARDFIRFALQQDEILIFQLIRSETTSTGYNLDFKIAFAEPYLAISHAWTDRSGPGDAIVVSDLAPWPITMSPAKRQLLSWLYSIQSTGGDWTSWFWMDLFCIDQTKEDEGLFSRQLQQIPRIFRNARSCLALLASWPCELALQMEELAEGDNEDTRYDYVDNWLKRHTTTCQCPALMDAWLTRVWTRQEVLYSRNLMFVTANVWLSHISQDPGDIWCKPSDSYRAPRATDGVRELASCLVTWCTRYGLKTNFFSSSIIADILRLLIRGEIVHCPLPDLPQESSRIDIPRDWFAFNWSIIVNASIRVTSHVRDAILSQMLLLPGYRVPETPWSMSLQDLMVESCSQYRRLLSRYQLVPMVFESRQNQPRPSNLAPVLSTSLQTAALSDILLSVGSPCTYPPGVFDDSEQELLATMPPYAAYEVEDDPRYRVLQTIDIAQHPIQAAEFILTLKQIWSIAADCTTSWNARECLDEIQRELDSNADDSQSLGKALMHYIGRLTHTIAFCRPHINYRVNPTKPYSPSEMEGFPLPQLRAVTISHRNASIPPYPALIFGDLSLGHEGPIWGMGIDKVTKLELGIIATDDGYPSTPIQLQASGALMPLRPRTGTADVSSPDRRFRVRQVTGAVISA